MADQSRYRHFTSSGGRARHDSGFTLLELVISSALLLSLFGSFFWVVDGAQRVTYEQSLITEARRRSQQALERIVSLTSGVVTSDASYTTFTGSSGTSTVGLPFRDVEDINSSTQEIVYSKTNTYLYGPDSGASANQGLVILRGESLSSAYSDTAGSDGILGTDDDVVQDVSTAGYTGTDKALEVLIPEDYNPSSGEMLTITSDADSDGRLLTITLRTNVKDHDGNFLLPKDLVLSQRIALRQ